MDSKEINESGMLKFYFVTCVIEQKKFLWFTGWILMIAKRHSKANKSGANCRWECGSFI